MATDIIQQFVDSLISEAGLGGGDEGRLQEYRERVMSLVNQFLGIEMMKWLSPRDTEELVDKIGQDIEPTSKEFYEFFSERIDHLDDKIVTALMSFKQDFIENLESVEDVV